MKPASIIKNTDKLQEVVEKRTAGSKTFRKEPNKFRLCKSMGAVHYKNDYSNTTEEWKEIDLSFRLESGKYIMDKAPYTLVIDPAEMGFTYTSKRSGDVKVKLKALDGVSVETAALSLSPMLDDNKFRWNELIPTQLDTYIVLRSLGCELFKTIKNAASPHTFEWEFDQSEEIAFTFKNRNWAYDAEGRKVKTNLVVGKSTIKSGRKTYTLTQSFENKTERADPETRIKSYVDEITYPVTFDVPDITELIVAGGDDVYSRDGGGTFWDAGDTVGRCGSYYNGFYTYFVGVRFQDIAVPQGATITLANLKVQNKNVVRTPKIYIYGDDVDNAVEWADSLGNRPGDIAAKTDAKAVWEPADDGWKTIEITNIIQEIVDREGWAEGDMRFAFQGQAVAAYTNVVHIYMYEKSQNDAVYLEIDYAGESIPRTPAGILPAMAGTMARKLSAGRAPKGEI